MTGESPDSGAVAVEEDDNRLILEEISRLIEAAGELLPPQGPITAFAFLNTLQGLEHLPFDEGMRRGGELYNCQPYLNEDQYRQRLSQGRITDSDLQAVVSELLADRALTPVSHETTRADLWLAMLRHTLRTGPAEELRWYVAETQALKQVRPEMSPALKANFIDSTRRWVLDEIAPHSSPDWRSASIESGQTEGKVLRSVRLLSDLIERFDSNSISSWDEETWEQFSLQALWRVCRDGIHRSSLAHSPSIRIHRYRDDLLARTGVDSDRLVNDVLIRFCAPFTDQGFADWALPCRESGFFNSFLHLYRDTSRSPEKWLRGLSSELRRITDRHLSPLESIAESLNLLAIPREEWSEFLIKTLLALRGWAGMLRQMEVRGDRVPFPVPAGTMVEYLAVRLILDRLAIQYVAARHLKHRGDLAELRQTLQIDIEPHEPGTTVEERAFDLFQLAQLLGWTPRMLFENDSPAWGDLEREIHAFSSIERRRVFHLAFERNYQHRALDAFSIQARRPVTPLANPRFQAVFCIDAREESFRRHLETVAPDVETFGIAGFFGVPVYYKGLADAHFSTLCPIVVRPRHWLVEDVILSLEGSHRRRSQTRKVIGNASRNVHFGSRSFAGGAILTATLGVLASFPLVARVLFPRTTSLIRSLVGKLVQPPPLHPPAPRTRQPPAGSGRRPDRISAS